jgi:hypothetical protein
MRLAACPETAAACRDRVSGYTVKNAAERIANAHEATLSA